MGGNSGRVFRNMHKGHVDQTTGGWGQGRTVGLAGVGGWREKADNCT